MPLSLEPVFQAALLSALKSGTNNAANIQGLSRKITADVLLACASPGGPQDIRIMNLLRRFEAEAAREEARRVTSQILDEAKVVQIEMDIASTQILIGSVASAEVEMTEEIAESGPYGLDQPANLVNFEAIELDLSEFVAEVRGEKAELVPVMADTLEVEKNQNSQREIKAVIDAIDGGSIETSNRGRDRSATLVNEPGTTEKLAA